MQIALRLGAGVLVLSVWGCASTGPSRTTHATPDGPAGPIGPSRVVSPPPVAGRAVIGKVMTRGAVDTVSLKQAVVYVVDDFERPAVAASAAPASQAAATKNRAGKAAKPPAPAPKGSGASRSAPPVAEPAPIGPPERMCQTANGFRPRIVAVPAGGLVEFDNCDSIYHSVFSLAKAKRFDTGLFAPGKARPVRFDRAGIVDIYCQLHARIVGYVVVVPNRHFARPNAQGEFRLPPLKEGAYVVKVWHPKFGETSQPLQIHRDGSGVVSIAY